MKATLLGEKYLYSSICDSIRGIFLKINIWNFKRTAYKPCHFGFDCPITKGTLLGKQSSFTAATQVPLVGISWKSTLATQIPLPTNGISLVAFGLPWSAHNSECKEPSQKYLVFHLRDFPETPQIAFYVNFLQKASIWLWSSNNEGHSTWRTEYIQGSITASSCIYYVSAFNLGYVHVNYHIYSNARQGFFLQFGP